MKPKNYKVRFKPIVHTYYWKNKNNKVPQFTSLSHFNALQPHIINENKNPIQYSLQQVVMVVELQILICIIFNHKMGKNPVLKII